METKKEIRQRILSKRGQMSPEERLDRSKAILSAVEEHPWYIQAEMIYCYVDFGSEVQTRELIKRALAFGKKVAVPRIQTDSVKSVMEFYQIRSLAELKPGTFGILEPDAVERADGASGLVLMPGVAFDRGLSRIGYGKGYYDRYLRQHTGLSTMALAFSLQCVEAVPSEPHDIRPRLLVTEQGIRKAEEGSDKE